MTHRCFVLVGMVVLGAAFAAGARADDEEPEFLKKKLSYWLTLLHEGKDVAARRRGVIGVEQIGHEKSKKVLPALIKATGEDKEAVVRAAAARALGRAYAKAAEQVRADKRDDLPRIEPTRDALTKALRLEKEARVREAAAAALGDIGPDARAAVSALGGALKDKSLGVVRAAAAALRRMGRYARDAETELQTLVADKKLPTDADDKAAALDARIDAAVALGQCNPEAATTVPVLRDAVADVKADPRLRRAATEALGKLGREAAEASGVLGKVLEAKDSPDELRQAAVTALDQFGDGAKPALPALVKAVADSDRFVRVLAMHALGRLGKELDEQRGPAVKAILKATDDSNVEVAVAAIETLGALADHLSGEGDEVVKRLDTILKREGRRSIREAAQAARDKIRPPKKK